MSLTVSYGNSVRFFLLTRFRILNGNLTEGKFCNRSALQLN